jgi:hypothetical protein
MKVTYRTLDGQSGTETYEAFVSQDMKHVDGFSIFGFETWEDVADEKVAWAITNVASFTLDRQKSKVGFHGQNKG